MILEARGEVNEGTGGSARSISDVPSDGNWIHETVGLIRSATGIHGFPLLDGHDLPTFGRRPVRCSALCLLG